MRQFIFLFAFLLSALVSFSQNEQSIQDNIIDLKKVVPPSPNTSAIAKYADWPVNLYTGLPNIDIPLCQLHAKGTAVPISLSYHAAGNKVGEVASWVGLGWSLNAGGVITRSVRGLPDEAPGNGSFAMSNLYSNPNDLCSNPSSILQGRQHKVDAAKGIADSEQDIYSFSGMGKSFKFFIKADGTVVPTKYSKIKVTTTIRNPNASYTPVVWIALLEDGTKLEFGGSVAYEENTEYTKFDIGYTQVPTTWLLKSLTPPNGETINFTYTALFIEQDLGISESDYLKYSLGTLHIGPGGTTCNPYDTYISHYKIKADRQAVLMRQISTIESNIARIEFELESAERQDLIGSKALSKIKVYSKLNSSYKEVYKFNYAYSNAVTSVSFESQATQPELNSYKKRLRLLSVEKQNNLNQTEQTWTFNYNPQNLPSRRSFATDHWGFYNGKNENNSLLPRYWYPLPTNIVSAYPNSGFNQPVFNPGVSKDGNETFLKAEILESVTYPTGGKSTFDYEANSIPVSEEQFVSDTKNVQLNLTALSNPFTTTQDVTFTVTGPQTVFLYTSFYISPTIFNDVPGTHVIAEVFKQGSSSSIGAIINPTGVSSHSETKYFNLHQAGTYILRISTNADQQSFGPTDAIIGSAAIVYELSQGFQLINKSTGGLRIKKMTFKDLANPSKNIEKSYQYETPLIISPINIKDLYFTETEEYTCEDVSNNEPPSYLACHNKIVTRNSSTKYTLGSVQGGTVGYSKVTVLHGLNGNNGKTITEFSNEQDAGLDMSIIFPFAPSDSREWRRGLMLKEANYTSGNVILNETSNNYQFLNKGAVSSFKAGAFLHHSQNATCQVSVCTDPTGDCNIQKLCFNTTAEQVNLLSTSAKTYDSGGQYPLTTITNYFYDNPDNPMAIRTETINSKGEVIKTISRTPLEKTAINTATPLTPAASAAIDDMLTKNIIAPVIQTEKYKNTTLLTRTLTNFKIWSPQLTDVENVQLQKGTTPIETRLTINAYDNDGNILEQQKAADVKYAYLYGYNKNYPVAQVAGVGSATIAALVDQTVLDNPLSTDVQIRTELNNLRTGLAGTQALVTTYTYKPLVGITSQIDPSGRITYYEYDNFNRLSLIRDQDNNILKKICYNYAGQPENCLSPCPPNSLPIWQNTTEFRCQQGSCGNTGYQEQKQIDINPCTNNNPQWIVIGQNTTACPLQTCVSLTSTNMYGNTGFTASYYNTVTAITYSFPVPATTGLQPLGNIPSGNYNLTISRAGSNVYGTYYSGCKFQAITGSTPVVFYNVPVSPSGCKSITLDLAN